MAGAPTSRRTTGRRARLPDRRRDQQVRLHRCPPTTSKTTSCSSTRRSSVCATPTSPASAAAGVPAGDGRRTRRRDHVDGRHPDRHRPRLVRLVHRRRAQGAARLHATSTSATSSSPREACQIEIDRARRAGRQAGPVHRRRRWPHRVRRFDPDESASRSAARPRAPLCGTGSRRTCCCSTPGCAGRRRRCSPSSRSPTIGAGATLDGRQPRPGPRDRLRDRDALEAGDLDRFGAAAHRAVAAEVRAVADATVHDGSTSGSGRARRRAPAAASWSAPAAAASCCSTPSDRPSSVRRWPRSGSRRSASALDYEGYDADRRAGAHRRRARRRAGNPGDGRDRPGHAEGADAARRHAFLDYKLAGLTAQGVTEVLMLVGHDRGRLHDHVGAGRCFGMQVDFVDDGPGPPSDTGAIGPRSTGSTATSGSPTGTRSSTSRWPPSNPGWRPRPGCSAS